MERDVIELFMWGYQRHVQISFQVSAESLFKKLNYRLDPKVFFIGVLVENRTDRHEICLEPEDCGFAPDNFSDLKKLATELEKVDEETKIWHSHPSTQKSHESRITTKSLIEAISKILKRDDFIGESRYFVGSPTYVEGFLVFPVLSLNKRVLESSYSLRQEKINDRYTIHRSLIESTIYTFLGECTNALKDPNNAINSIRRNADELMRDSGRQFMYTISSAGGNFDGLHGLYEACNEIASMKYEGAVGIGKIIITPKDHKNVKLTLQLKEPIKISNYRKVRKFLELSDNQTSIVSDSALIYGLGEIRGKYNPQEENLFEIGFTSHFKWEISHDNNPLMIVEYREPSLPVEKINRDKFYSDFLRLFSGITKEQIDDLWDVAMEATKQKHGTMLVVSDDAENESERLEKQSLALKPLKLNDKIIQQITAIDGAVLLDRNTICFAIGVILDGLATDKGDSSRGARFNSAIRYYEQAKSKTSIAIVIVSEDGMINLIPDLRPQIKHSDISKALKDFNSILEADKLNHKAFNQGMSFFQSINFYLTSEECEQVNELRMKIEEKFKEELSTMRIVYEDLMPNPEMNDSYYKNE